MFLTQKILAAFKNSVSRFIMLARCYPAVTLFLVVLGFYIYTLAPSLVWADGNRLQLEVILNGSLYFSFEEFKYFPSDGLPFARLGITPWDHPLYIMLGQLFLALPFGEELYRINLMSALFGAITVAFVYRVGLFLVGDRRAAILGALTLAVSHTFWFNAVTAEVYSIHTAFMISSIWLFLRWQQTKRYREIMLMALLAGLGLANHIMFVLVALPLGAYVWVIRKIGSGQSLSRLSPIQYKRGEKRLSGWKTLGVIGMFLTGFAPWWIQFVRFSNVVGLQLTLQSVTWFPALPNMLLDQSEWSIGENMIHYIIFLLFQFTPIGVALGIYGMNRAWRSQNSSIAPFFFILFAIHVIFSANYPVPDRFQFHVPSYLILSLFIIIGLAGILARIDVKLPAYNKYLKIGIYSSLFLIILLPIFIYSNLQVMLRTVGITESELGVPKIGTGARDGIAYFLVPNKRNDDSAAIFGRSTLLQLPSNALVFTAKPGDREVYFALSYFQIVEGIRPDVHLESLFFWPQDDIPEAVLEFARSQVSCRPLYLASLNSELYPLRKLENEFKIVPEGNLYRLLPRQLSAYKFPCPDINEGKAYKDYFELVKIALRVL